VNLASDETFHGEAVAITVVDGSPHIAGFHYTSSNDKKPCLWDKDGKRTDLKTDGQVRLFAFHGSNPYMAGRDSDGAACYWSRTVVGVVGGTQKTLLSGCDGVSAIHVPYNDEIYVGGYKLNSFTQERPYVWKNGELAETLATGGVGNNQPIHIKCMGQEGASMYICGTMKYGLRYQPVYWVPQAVLTEGGSELQNLPSDPNVSGDVVAISASRFDVYILGYDGSNYCVWKVFRYLPDKFIIPGATGVTAIADLENTVYVSGSSNGKPCYWDREGNIRSLDVNGGKGAALAIALY
jgi:hypothetical protein